MNKTIVTLFLLGTLFVRLPHAEPAPLQPFGPDSYGAILEQNDRRPLMLVLWSLTCSSCMKEMGMLNKIRAQHPELAVVLVSVDDFADAEQVREVLEKNRLSELNNWLFTEANSARLRYQIDPTWYGELPRTYFFNTAHEKTAVSGVLSEEDYERLIGEILS